MDHLLLDQDAIPTLVEVKRSSDTRIRREVVGQMLDYAANVVIYLDLDVLRTRYEDACGQAGRDPEAEVAEILGTPDSGYDEFWERAKTNLAAGRIRLVFVADAIPPELQRIVEFLNERMSPTDVLAVEIRQYVGGGEQMLIPRVLGQTAKAREKRPRTRPHWDEGKFFAALSERHASAAATARKIVQWARDRNLRMAWTGGSNMGACWPVLDHAGEWYAAIGLWTYAKVELQFARLKVKKPFDDEMLRREFIDRLNAIPTVAIPVDSFNRQPSFPLADLSDEQQLATFLHVLDWFYDRVTQ